MSVATKTVLFVCIENTFRSILSEAIFNSKAPRGWRAESAGVNPGKAVNMAVKDLLQEIGVEMTTEVPKAATPQMVSRASRVVTFGCLDRCPIGAEGKVEDWPVPGAAGKDPNELREIRDELGRRVDNLIARHCLPVETLPS